LHLCQKALPVLEHIRESMLIFVKHGERVECFFVSPSQLILDLKLLCAARFGLSASGIRFLFAGRVLVEFLSFSGSNIEKESTLQMSQTSKAAVEEKHMLDTYAGGPLSHFCLACMCVCSATPMALCLRACRWAVPLFRRIVSCDDVSNSSSPCLVLLLLLLLLLSSPHLQIAAMAVDPLAVTDCAPRWAYLGLLLRSHLHDWWLCRWCRGQRAHLHIDRHHSSHRCAPRIRVSSDCAWCSMPASCGICIGL
jgi:hypothetical protein